MILKTIISIVVLPGFFGILIPYLILHNDFLRTEGYPTGFILILSGSLIITRCIFDFYQSGKGTLAPWAPPLKLVTTGLYKYSRNPMYIGVLLMVSGIAVFSGSPFTLLYGIILLVGFHLRIIYNEEPFLEKQFKDEWRKYSNKIPRWISNVKNKKNGL